MKKNFLYLILIISLTIRAKIATLDAGNELEPRLHTKHNLNKLGNSKFGVCFDHYHPYLNAATYNALGFEIPVGHSFFGVPSISI
jgi:hypothetical protein